MAWKIDACDRYFPRTLGAAGDILRRKTMLTEMSASFRLQPNTMRDFYEHRSVEEML